MSKQVTGHIDDEVHARLLAEAERRDVTVSYLVSRAVERALRHWEAQDLDERPGGEQWQSA